MVVWTLWLDRDRGWTILCQDCAVLLGVVNDPNARTSDVILGDRCDNCQEALWGVD